MILALLLFPQGIFGRREVARYDRAPAIHRHPARSASPFSSCSGSSSPTGYEIGLMMRCMILMIVTIGLNILIGHAGLVSLGQAALYGLGAYVAAWLAVKQGVQFLPAVIAGVVVTGLFGAALAYPTVRVRGVYLAVITIAFGLVFQNILVEWLPVTGGTQGLIGIPRGNVFGISLTRPIYFWVVAGCLIVAFILQYNVIHSRYGRAMRATAQSENAAKALGINLAATRTLAFVISATLAGLAGGLYTFLNLFVNYETFTFFHSVAFLLMVILGGTGTLARPGRRHLDPHLHRRDPAGPAGVADLRLRLPAGGGDVRHAAGDRRHLRRIMGTLRREIARARDPGLAGPQRGARRNSRSRRQAPEQLALETQLPHPALRRTDRGRQCQPRGPVRHRPCPDRSERRRQVEPAEPDLRVLCSERWQHQVLRRRHRRTAQP